VNPFCKLKRSQARGRETKRESEVGGVERMRVSERERERASEQKTEGEKERQRGRVYTTTECRKLKPYRCTLTHRPTHLVC